MKTPGFDYDSGYSLVDALGALGTSCGGGSIPSDLNGDGNSDLAGLTSAGQIYYTVNLGAWKNIPGTLAQLRIGDLDGDGHADLAGLTGAGNIYYTTNLGTWKHIPGRLERLAGNTD